MCRTNKASQHEQTRPSTALSCPFVRQSPVARCHADKIIVLGAGPGLRAFGERPLEFHLSDGAFAY